MSERFHLSEDDSSVFDWELGEVSQALREIDRAGLTPDDTRSNPDVENPWAYLYYHSQAALKIWFG